MNELFSQLLKVTPVYLLVVFAFCWLIVKALPDTSQFFADLLPRRRRHSRVLALLESLKAKAEATEIAHKYGIQPKRAPDEAMRADIDALLGTPDQARVASRVAQPVVR